MTKCEVRMTGLHYSTFNIQHSTFDIPPSPFSMASQPDSSARTTTGARLFIIALLSFYFLGYSQFFSICLGAIAGVCGGFISSWWNATEDYVTDESTEPVQSEEGAAITVAQPRPRRYGMGVKLARQPQETRAAKGRFGWLRRRNRS